MSVFDSFWSAASERMHAAVDQYLSDTLLYAMSANVPFVPLPGFVITIVAGEGGMDGLDDDLAVRKRVKIAKALVPTISTTHRIQHPRLGPGTFRPTNSVPETEDRYWVFDIQKVA